jgi:hypothetical protein
MDAPVDDPVAPDAEDKVGRNGANQSRTDGAVPPINHEYEAAKCRRLAASVNDDQANAALLKLAAQHEECARTLRSGI